MNVNAFIASEDVSIIDALTIIDKNGYGILFIVDKNKKLLGSLSDGDIRRWIIKTNILSANVSDVMNNSPKYVFENEKNSIKDIIERFPISTVPVVNNEGCVVDIVVTKGKVFDDTAKSEDEMFNAPVVIMAGGKGTRLYPYTKILPKPLIPIGDTPILERIINKFNSYGINKFYLTVNYKKGMIKSYFADMKPDYYIEYVEEDKPLGTGGSIKLIKESFDVPIIVANCDQIVNANYKDLYDYHKTSGNLITIVSSLKNITVPYGVLKTRENGELVSMEEKPKLSYFINTGMYVINPEIIELIPDNQMFHMTHLIEKVKDLGWKVGMYPISEDSFLDMGEFDEMKRMEEKLSVLSNK